MAPVPVVDTATTITMISESTRVESQSSLLGEKSLSATEVDMTQQTDITTEVNIREESQDSMAEIRQILSTSAEVNEYSSDVDMSEQEQKDNEQEVTITAILEEINKSASSKSNNSIREEQLNEPGLNNMRSSEVEFEGNWVINEQSTRDESQGSLLGEISQDPTSEAPMKEQVAVTTTNATLQDFDSSEWIMPREEFELIDDPNSREILIYGVVVAYQGVITSTTQMEEEVMEIKT